MTTPVSPLEPPTVAQVRAWTGVTVASMTDDLLSVVLLAEQVNQGIECDVPLSVPVGLIPAPLYQALLRRCAREIAARGVPMGLVSSDEFGTSRLPTFDAEISRLENPWRRMGFA